jgi:hypothetical protein
MKYTVYPGKTIKVNLVEKTILHLIDLIDDHLLSPFNLEWNWLDEIWIHIFFKKDLK